MIARKGIIIDDDRDGDIEYSRFSRVDNNYIPWKEQQPYLRLNLKADNKQDVMILRRFNWLTAMGDVGGLGEFIFFTASMMISYFVNVDYMVHVI
jgi:hypothetical protein